MVLRCIEITSDNILVKTTMDLSIGEQWSIGEERASEWNNLHEELELELEPAVGSTESIQNSCRTTVLLGRYVSESIIKMLI